MSAGAGSRIGVICWLGLAASLAWGGVAGCFPAQLDETGKNCSEARPCGAEYVCVQGKCARSGDGGTDGGVLVPGVLVPRGAVWRYRPGTGDPGGGWTNPSLDDSSWASGPAPLGYGEEEIRSVVDLRDAGLVTLYARTSFNLAGLPDGGQLLLRVKYDDGFVAFINGHEVRRANVPNGQTWNTPASNGHTAESFESFNVTPDVDRLRVGGNVLSLEVHNASVNSSDLYLDAELSVTAR